MRTITAVLAVAGSLVSVGTASADTFNDSKVTVREARTEIRQLYDTNTRARSFTVPSVNYKGEPTLAPDPTVRSTRMQIGNCRQDGPRAVECLVGLAAFARGDQPYRSAIAVVRVAATGRKGQGGTGVLSFTVTG